MNRIPDRSTVLRCRRHPKALDCANSCGPRQQAKYGEHHSQRLRREIACQLPQQRDNLRDDMPADEASRAISRL